MRDSPESSSSDEETFADALREATDHQFLKESFFIPKDPQSTQNNDTGSNDKSNPVSLRKDLEQKEKFDNFGLTPELKNFVAKKLDKMLDASIRTKSEEEIQSTSHKKRRRKEEDRFGVKLLNTSTNFLTTDEEVQDIKIKKLKRKKVKENEADRILKYQEAAVGPEWILSREDTKAWTNKWTNREFKYRRLKNGILVEQT